MPTNPDSKLRAVAYYAALGLLIAGSVLLIPPVIGALVYWIGQVWWLIMSSLGVAG